MGRTRNTARKSDPAVNSLSRNKRRHLRTSLSQCPTALLRLHRRIAEEELVERKAMESISGIESKTDEDAKAVRLSQRAREFLCFLVQSMEHQVFGQCRKLMKTRTMSPKLLTASYFLCWDKELAREASMRANEYCLAMNELDEEVDAARNAKIAKSQSSVAAEEV
jgi:hypothetical protein